MKRALVTGAGGRVGQAIAVELARSGFEVAIHYRSSAAGAEHTLAECRAAGGDGWLVRGDVGTLDGCRHVVAAVSTRWDTLDLLVNNASIFAPVPFGEATLDDWSAMQDVNLRAPFLLSQGLLSRLRAAEGVVVHMCDIGADRPVAGFAPYSVSKAGLVMLVKAMAVELAPQVRTVGVSPGQVAWPDDYPEEKRERLARRIPMKRVGTPDDVARLVRFLATEAPYLNGVVVPVDGGLSVRY